MPSSPVTRHRTVPADPDAPFARRRRTPPETSMRILMEIMASDAPISAARLATTHRMTTQSVLLQVAPLIEMGLLARAPNHLLMPGPGIHALAGLSMRRSRLLTHAAPLLRELASTLKRPVSLGVLWQTTVCPLYHGDATTSVDAAISPASELIPAEQCAIGLLLLANRGAAELARILAASGYDELARADLALRLQSVSQQQYAWSPNHDSIAVAVGTGSTAGIAVHGSISNTQLPELLDQLRRTAEAIGERLHRQP